MTAILHAEIRAVHLSGQQVLHGIEVKVRPGRWTAIVGPNGAGKSTLLRTLAGLQACDGSVTLEDKLIGDWPAKLRARTMAWLGQGEAGADDLRAADVVMLGRLPHQAWLAQPAEADHRAVEEAMHLTQSWPWRHRPMGQLSGGERQRVFLARALSVQARVVLMDEPLAHLDPPHQADWLDIVRSLGQRGVTVLSVLHELNMALMADELIVMDQGRVVHHGQPGDARTQAALGQVFDGRVRLIQVDGQWVALPGAPRATGAKNAKGANHGGE
jgi:iron complex transport system ATP-binding protein